MSKFSIPVTWEMYGTVIVEAPSLDEAIKKFDKTQDEIDLPHDKEYVDGSFRREGDEDTIKVHNEFAGI